MIARTLFSVTLACALMPAAAQAREWIITVGAKTSASPPYEGADHMVISPSPTFSLRPASFVHRFSPPDPGMTFALIDSRRVTIGPMVRFRRDREDKGDLTGLETIDRAVEPGAFLDLWPTDWLRLHVEGRRGVTGHKGWVGDAGLDLVYSGGRWDASVGPRVGFGDAKYMDTYFGVTAAEAARSPRINTAYEPSKGRRYTGVTTAVAYHFNKHWRTSFNVSYQRLADKAAASPVVQEAGMRDQYSAGVGVSYSFGVGR